CGCRNRELLRHQWLFSTEDLRSERQSVTIAAAEKTSTYLCARCYASAVKSRNLRLNNAQAAAFIPDGELCAPRFHYCHRNNLDYFSTAKGRPGSTSVFSTLTDFRV